MSMITTIKNIFGIYREGETVTRSKKTQSIVGYKTLTTEKKVTVVKKNLLTQTERPVEVQTIKNKLSKKVESAVEITSGDNVRLTILSKLALSAAAISIFNAPIIVAVGIMALPAVPKIEFEGIEIIDGRNK